MSREKLHLTVAALVHYQGRFLFVEEKDKYSGRRVLNQPAGHMEENEHLVAAMERELFEETGLRLQPDYWMGISQLTTAHQHIYVRINFVFTPAILPEYYQPQDSDILALHWLSQEEFKTFPIPERSPLVTDTLQRYQNGVYLPLNLIRAP